MWRYAGAPTYQWQQAATGTVLLDDTHANRVANYPASTYPDALFVETDTLLLLWSTGGIWTTLAGTVQDTHANRLSSWPSVQFSAATLFYETDRTVTYTVRNATGTVNTSVSGTTYTVTWVSGNHFVNTGTGFTAAQWPAGTPIVINGVTYTVKTVASDTSLTLNTSAGTQAGVDYSVASGRWVYLSGQYSAALASLPTDLGENETTLVSSEVALGFLYFENAAYYHQLQWNVSAWQRGPADRDHSDTFVMCGSAPSDGGFHICDGSSVNFMKYDGTTGSRTLPDITGSGAYPKAETSYAAPTTAAVAPTVTPTGTIAASSSASSTGTFTGNASGSTNVLNTGGSTAVVPAPFTPAGAVAVSTSVATTATFSGGSDSTSLGGGDPVANFGVLVYYRQ